MAGAAGGEIIARMLAAEDVEVVFGIIDGTYYGLYASLPDQGIRLVSPRHETSALHMAGAYARQTRRLGVAIASNGPGVANALPGIAVEQGEGNRVLVVSSSRRTGLSAPDRHGAFQSFDQVAVTAPMTKWSVHVPSRERIPELVRRALRMAWSGRPGVVHLDVPEDILNGEGRFEASEIRPPRSYRRTIPIEPDASSVESAAALLRRATAPLIHAGTGVVHAGAGPALQRLAEALGAPILTSWGGRGVVSEEHPLTVPMIHLDLYQRLRVEADVVLVLGSRLGETDWWGKAPYWSADQTVIQVDVDDASLGATKPVDLAVLADAAAFCERLSDALDADPPARRDDTWTQRRRDARAKLDRRLEKHTGGGVHPGEVPRICQDTLPDDTVWVLDGGNAVIWSQHYLTARTPLVATFKLGMLGAGVAQALGAKVAQPERPVCCLIGDGAMGFHPQELETAVREGLAVIYVVFCDLQWGMVKMNQQFTRRPVKTLIRKSLGPDETINTDLSEIRFDDLARSMGAHGERVSEASELRPALERAVASGLPAVLHVDVDPVAHMWAPSLRAFKEMHEEPSG